MRTKKIQIIVYLLIIGIFFSSCFSEKKYFNVKKIQKIEEFTEEAIIYSLPKTTIVVEVEITKIIQTKGPFNEYTEQLLGNLGSTINSNNTEWKISDIDFYSYPETDTSNIYVINTNSNNFSNCVRLSEEGFLLSINQEVDKEHNFYKAQEKDLYKINQNEYLSYGKLSLDKNYKEVFDTIYQTKQTDTSIIRIPVIKKSIIKKSIKEQSEELAEEILILRDDRKALLVGEGDNEYLPDGDALKLMIEKLEDLEQQYLTMFVGETNIETYHYKFEITPTIENLNSQIILFRFTPVLGIQSWSNSLGEPIVLELQVKNDTKPINNYIKLKENSIKESKKEIPQGLFYRIPEKTTVVVKKNNKTLSKSNIYIAQFGTVNSLPAKLFLDNNNYSIDFYYDLGSIKKIEKK